MHYNHAFSFNKKYVGVRRFLKIKLTTFFNIEKVKLVTQMTLTLMKSIFTFQYVYLNIYVFYNTCNYMEL